MTTSIAPPLHRSAAAAYDQLAPVYDILTGAYRHAEWLAAIEALAVQHGLSGRAVLDLACGTGKSFLPLIASGYDVAACDGSEAMVALARAKAPNTPVLVADIRELPQLGRFDLITCLDDAVNYLLTVDDLDRFFDGVARNLARHGVLIFDVNSLRLYRTDFGTDWVVDTPDSFIAWSAPPTPELEPVSRVTADVHVFTSGKGGWTRSISRHVQNHWPQAVLDAAAGTAGLAIEAVYGQHRGAILDTSFSELDHHKALYVVKHASEEVTMKIIGPR
jgi:SAM-dependent methyltransferase